MYTSTLLSVVGLLTATAFAAPVSEGFSSLSDGFVEIETRDTYPTCTKNCTQFSLNDDSFTAEWTNSMRVPYDLLWTKARELCTTSACDRNKVSTAQLNTESNTGVKDELTLQLDGQFPAAMMDDLFALVQNAFYKGMAPVQSKKSDDGSIVWYTATGPGYLNVNYFGPGGNSGAHLTAWIVKKKAEGLNVCSLMAGTINTLGSAIVPELSPVFGAVSATCAI